jgi:protocatechuate 3,4-dioxygenase beta subunit
VKSSTRATTKSPATAKALAVAVAKALALSTTLALALLAHASARECVAQSPAVVVANDDARATQSATASQTPAQTQSPARPGGAGGGGRVDEPRERGTGFINGRVVGEAGEPLPGVSVYAAPRGYVQMYRPQRTTTDDEGNFTITGLDPGLYGVVASMPGYVIDTDPSTSRPAAYRPGDTASVRLIRGGVITGTVTDPQGEPVVAISVRAYRVRDLEGRPVPFGFGGSGEDGTDDRGVFRMYGLTPGVYVVSAGGSGRDFFYGIPSAYAGNVATFYPSATRDTASEVTVRAGQENAGVDIRYRDEQGRSVSGRVELPAGAQADPNVGFSVTLAYASSGIQAASAFVPPASSTPSFSFEGVADGEYDLQAWAAAREGQTASSPSQRVSVRGADVTGLRLALAPLSTVSGTLVIEQATEAERARETCKWQRPSMLPQETLVAVAVDRPAPSKGQAASRFSLAREATPDASGAFTLRALEPGRYRLNARPFDEALYTHSIKLPATNAAATDAGTPARANVPANAGASARTQARAAADTSSRGAANARETLDVRAGQQVNGVVVRLAQGAALLSGRIVLAEGAAAPLFSQTRVHLVPAERESADDPLRYFDATPDGAGAFTFKSVPPGRYLLVARPAPEPVADAPARPAHWDADSRARLRREAEAANASVELQPCQRTTDFTLRLPK